MFYARLMELRKKKGLSQEELGEQIGVTRQTVSKWELGLTTPELDKLIDLARVFQCSVDYLIGNEPPMPEKTGETTADELDENAAAQTVNGDHAPVRIFVKPEYEYKSKTMIGNLPLVHIHFGLGLCRAKGIIAIGNIATGVVAIGGLAVGLLSLGGVALGLLAIGGLAFALLLALGGLAVGTLSFGGIAIGIIAVGGIAWGIWSIGGVAVASQIAGGGAAWGHIAIAAAPSGSITFNLETSAVLATQIKQAILTEFPKTWQILVDIFSLFGR